MEERAGERRPDLHGKKELKSTQPALPKRQTIDIAPALSHVPRLELSRSVDDIELNTWEKR